MLKKYVRCSDTFFIFTKSKQKKKIYYFEDLGSHTSGHDFYLGKVIKLHLQLTEGEENI